VGRFADCIDDVKAYAAARNRITLLVVESHSNEKTVQVAARTPDKVGVGTRVFDDRDQLANALFPRGLGDCRL
jgi:hypothetical protein